MLVKKKKDGIVTSTGLNLQTIDRKPYEITVEGSLGVLALGHLGLQAWRTKRQAHEAQQTHKASNEKEITK